MEQTISKTSSKENIQKLAQSWGAQDKRSAEGRQALETLDFPTTRIEDWKYTRTTRISSVDWQPSKSVEQIDITPFMIPELDAEHVVFINGMLDTRFSTIAQQGLTIENGAGLRKDTSGFENIFQAMNAAICTGHLQIRIDANTLINKSIHIIHIITNDGALAQPSINITIGKSSTVHFVESFASLPGKPSFTNRKLNMQIAENAQVIYDKIQIEGQENFLLNDETIRIDKDARFTINTLTVDGGWIRNSLKISLEGENIESNLHGIYLLRNKQFADNHTQVDHRMPHCQSSELYKGLLNDQSTGVFNGKVKVHPDAQKTVAYQSNANIIMNDAAQMNSKPELEIYADDVKCSHGTTTGQLDENALFYLRSRGLSQDGAIKLLTTAFISDVLDKVENEVVKSFVIQQLTVRELLYD